MSTSKKTVHKHNFKDIMYWDTVPDGYVGSGKGYYVVCSCKCGESTSRIATDDEVRAYLERTRQNVCSHCGAVCDASDTHVNMTDCFAFLFNKVQSLQIEVDSLKSALRGV